MPRRLDVPGDKLEGIHYLRTLGDSEAIGERIERGQRLVVVGSGWIGAEIAASAREKGCEVTMLEMASLPLGARAWARRSARSTSTYTAITVSSSCPETTVERFEGDGSVERVVTGDGAVDRNRLRRRRHRRRAAHAASSRRRACRSTTAIVVDEHLETSAPGVFAAGDVANAWHPFYGHNVRVEHWANALNQGPASGQGDARPGRELRRDPVLLLRPVRRRDGVLRLRDRVGRGRLPRRRRSVASSSPSGSRTSAWSPG